MTAALPERRCSKALGSQLLLSLSVSKGKGGGCLSGFVSMFAPGFGLVQLANFLCVREPGVRGQPSEMPERKFKLKNQHEVNQLPSFGLVTEKLMTQDTSCRKQYLE